VKLIRSGRHKFRTIKILVDVELPTEHGFLLWNTVLRNFTLRMRGLQGPSTYHYDLQFSADELALLVETTLTQASEDGEVHAQAKAIGAFIREVLDEKNKPADT